MAKCRYCNDTGKIALFTSIVDCDCVRPSPSSTSNSEHPQDFPKDSDLMNGWYSPAYAARHGVVVYLHAITRQEITITEISTASTPYDKLPDLKFVGIIDKSKRVRGRIHY